LVRTRLLSDTLQEFVTNFGLHLGTFESLFKGVDGGIEGMLGRFLMKFHTLTQAYFWVRLGMPYGEQPPLLCYQKLIDAITQQEWQSLPFLPATFMKSATEGGGKKSGRGGSTTNNAGASGTSGGNSANTGATALPTSPRASPSGSPATAAVQQVKNEHDVTLALVQRFEAWAKPLSELTKREDLTKAFVDGATRNRGDQICWAFHLRKACYSGCGRSSLHRKLSITEVTKVAHHLYTLPRPLPSVPLSPGPPRRIQVGSHLKRRARKKKRKAPYDLLIDHLGKLVTVAVHNLHNAPSWEAFVHECRGP
jgi:hypothetical protein